MRPPLLALLSVLLALTTWPAFAYGGVQEAAPAAVAPPASASTPEGVRGSIGVFGGISTAGADGLEGGSVFGGNAAFFFTKRLGLEAGVHRRSQDVVATSSNELSGGSLDSTIVTGGLVLRFPVGARVALYVVGGVAYFSNKFEVDPAVTSTLGSLNFRVSEEVKSVVGFQAGGGVDFLVARRFAVFAEARYLGGSADTRAELTDTVADVTAEVTGSQDLNALELRAGVRFVFPRGKGKGAKP
jgi:opacity protein-like surface antigen